MSYAIGKFRAKATMGELGYANSGTEQIVVQFEILEGADAGRTMTWWGYFTPKTADNTLKSLLLCGWDGDDISVLKGLGNTEVRLTIEDEDYNGEKRQRIRWINPASGPAVKKPMAKGEKAAFAAKMKGLTLSIQSQEPAPPTPPTPPPAADGDDDIPF